MSTTTRRRFLRLAGMAMAGAGLAACARTKVTNETEPVVAAQVTPVAEKVAEQPGIKEVRIARCGWLEADLPFDQQAAAYNALPERELDQVSIVFDPVGKASDDPVLAEMMAAGEAIPWNGHNCMTPFLQLANSIALDTVQAIDPYAEASQYREATQRLFGAGAFLTAAQKDCSYQGQWYVWPLQAEAACLIYRKDYFAALGQDVPPATMEDLLEVCTQVQEAYQAEGVWGFAPLPACLWRYAAAMQQTYTLPEQRFSAQGLINIADEGWYEAMAWTQACVDAGLVPPGWETALGWESLLSGGTLAAQITSHSDGVRAAATLGYDKLALAPLPVGNARVTQPGTMLWFSGASLFKAAPYPQAATDYYVWAMDPHNAPMGEAVFDSGKLAAWYGNYAQYVDKDDVTRNWALNLLPTLENATPAPVTPWYALQDARIGPQFVAYLQGRKSAEQAVRDALAELQAELDAT